MRNPFPRIGKVIKYEFKHSARTLLPLYGVLLVLGLLTGLSVNRNKYDKLMSSMFNNESFSYSVQGQEAAADFISAMLALAVMALTIAVSVITIVGLARRFKQSMLGEEAYLNLSLPLTMGEQLWGRLIMDFLWLLCCGVVICLSFLLCFVKMNLPEIFAEIRRQIPELNETLMQSNLSIAKVTSLFVLMGITAGLWIISFIFVANAITHLFKNNKSLVKIVAVIALLWLAGRSMDLFTIDIDAEFIRENGGAFFVRNMLIASGINFLWAAIYFAATQFVFTKKLNLE